MISYEKQENAHPGKSQPVYRLIIAIRSIFDQSFFLPCSAPPAQHHADRTAAFICCQTDISTHYCQMQLYPQQIRSSRCTQKHENSSEDHRKYSISTGFQCISVYQICYSSGFQGNILSLYTHLTLPTICSV